MWSHWLRKWFRPVGKNARRHFRPKVELLEDRRLLATFTVTNTVDDGDAFPRTPGSFRQAIWDAQATPEQDTILFNIPGTGPVVRTIRPLSPLPTIGGGGAIIDGTSQPGYSGTPLIELDGSLAGTSVNASGLTLFTLASHTIKGLIINRFNRGGIRAVSQTGTTTIQGCWIGLDSTGMASAGNGGPGIDVAGTNTLIGGSGPGQGNVISGNVHQGILISSGTGVGNVVEGNLIGLNVAGTAAVPNGTNIPTTSGRAAIAINAPNIRIGGTTPGAGNVISGNAVAGISAGYGGTGMPIVMQGNIVGLNPAGTVAIPNNGNGVELGVGVQTLGGTVPGARNVISGNTGVGVAVFANNCTVQGNYIGTNAAGTAALGNGGAGIQMGSGATTTGTLLGGTDATMRNLVSGNLGPGIHIGQNAGSNTVHGNWVGLNAAGTAALPNVVGVRVSGLNQTLGGTAAGAGNIISGNTGAGVLVDTGIATTTSHVLGNRIGTTPDGLSALPNTGEGIFLNARNHRIGGTAPGEANVIAFNGGPGVFVSHVLVNGNAIRGNSIHSNGGLGIDLAPVGVTPNDNSDGDAGPNNLQNFPLPLSVTPNAITGTLNSTQLTTFTLDFYASATADASGHGEGAVHVGSTTVTTDGEGRVLFTAPLSAVVAVGQFLTATATDPAGNTSEFSPAVAVTSTGRPAVSDLFDQTILEDSSTGTIVFHVGDPDTPAASLTVTASSSNPTLTPTGSLILGGSGMDRTLTVTPAANQSGTATITITVSDGVLTSTDIFLLTVTTVNDLPVLVNNTGLNVTSGATLVLTSSHLLATDSDNTAAQLVYSLRTVPANGALQLNGVGQAVGGTFTQQDILDGQVRYVHNGSGTTTDSFTFDLSDRFPRVEFISRDPTGGMGNGGSDFEPSISATGRHVVFWSASSNLVPNDTNNLADTFLFDRQTGQMERISIGLGGAQPNGASGGGNTWRIVDVSDDGRYVAFASRASNLVAGDANAAIDIFLRDRQAGTTAIVSVSSSGALGNGDASEVAMSADGNVIAFVSNANNLTPNPDSFGDDVFVHDRRSGRTTRVSRSTTGGAPSAHSDEIALSADGRYLVFSSGANNLVPGDTNGVTDVFLYDIRNGALTRVSVDSSGAQATGTSTHPAISGDGRFIVFESSATNLVPGDTNNRTDLFVRDIQTGTTIRIPAEGGAQPVWNSVRASINYDGRYVAFQYGASDQQPGRQEDVMLYDRLTDQTVEASLNGSGVSANGDAERAAISGDGQYIAFPSHAGNLVPGVPGNTFAHIFVAKTGIITANVNITITPSQGLRVTTFTSTATGFTAVFSQAIDLTVLNLYDTQTGGLGLPDVTVVDAGLNPVRGSLVTAPDGRSVTFIRTGAVLTSGTYTVTLRSASNGFKTASGGELLDGNGDGTPGDDYTNTITATSGVSVSIPDFMRGPDQPIHVPATSTGLPLRLSDSTGVAEVMLTLRYNPNLIIITGATALPAGSNVTLDISTPGTATLHFTDTTPSAGITDFVRLTANVPASAGVLYTHKQLLDLTSLSINGGAITALDDDGLHVNAYFGDTTGNAGYSSTDATRTSRVVVGLDSGFSAYQLADPVIIADITGNGLLTSTDALRIVQESIGQDRAEIPALPTNPPTIVVSGPDPLLSIPRRFRARPGSLVSVPVNLDRSEGLDSANLALSFDPRLLEIVKVDRGSLTRDFDLFAVNVDAEAGTIRVGLGRSAGALDDRGSGSVLTIVFRVREDASAGRAIINLRHSLGATTTQLNEGGLDLQPDPSDEAGDVLDGAISVQGQSVKRATTDLIFAAAPDRLYRRWEVMSAFVHAVGQNGTTPPKRRRG